MRTAAFQYYHCDYVGDCAFVISTALRPVLIMETCVYQGDNTVVELRNGVARQCWFPANCHRPVHMMAWTECAVMHTD